MNKQKESAVKQAEKSESENGQSQNPKNVGGDYFADFDFGKVKVDMREMLKSGVHFGHQKARKNPKMGEYIFTTKSGINIIDLEKSAQKMEEASQFISKIISEGQELLLVGTKKQSKKLVKSLARRLVLPFVTERWLGGTFTNFKNISTRTKFLRDGEEKMKKGEFSQYTKFEQMKISEELKKLEEKMGGIKTMTKLPMAIFVASLVEDNLAVQEAIRKNIPIIALADTNVDPSEIDYPIPANDDAVSSLKTMLAYIGKAVEEGKSLQAKAKSEIPK